MIRRIAAVAMGAGPLLVLAACASTTPQPRPSIIVERELPWRDFARDEDIDRLARVDMAWAEALGEARARGAGRAIAAEGELLDPLAALPRPSPSPGSYSCRVIRIGLQGRRGRVLSANKPYFCYVDAVEDHLSLVKQTGHERPAGRVYASEREDQLVFLGSLVLGREEETPAYGDRPDRDVAGLIERVAPFRYRVVMPWPRSGATLDVIELVPVVE